MRDLQTAIVLWLARTINPPVQPSRTFQIDLEALRQLPEGTLGREVAHFLDQNGFTPFDSGDLIQRTHDIWHVLTGLSVSEHDEFILQAFTRAQIFRPSSAILVLWGVLSGQLKLADVIDGLNRGRLAQRLVDWIARDIESDWGTPLAEVRQKLGIVPFEI